MDGPDLRPGNGGPREVERDSADLTCPWCGQVHPIRLVRQLFPPAREAHRDLTVDASPNRSGGFVAGTEFESDPGVGEPGYSAFWSLEIARLVKALGRASKGSPVPDLTTQRSKNANERTDTR